MNDLLRQNSEIPTWNRISQIELNTSYIHNQYRSIMKRLHTEIEQLKSANRDLQFQLVLLHQENQDHLAYSTASEDNQNHSTDSKKKKTMYEFDFGSRHCLLQLKCERCQQYTPLRVNCIKPDGKLVSGRENVKRLFFFHFKFYYREILLTH
uniref:CCDC92/74 N-terminal domain-containing protein n=1 Tax=Cacopsylla melanoneura TaxID=428564 RepID=A0A8D8ZXA9_9HEMI